MKFGGIPEGVVVTDGGVVGFDCSGSIVSVVDPTRPIRASSREGGEGTEVSWRRLDGEGGCSGGERGAGDGGSRTFSTSEGLENDALNLPLDLDPEALGEEGCEFGDSKPAEEGDEICSVCSSNGIGPGG